MTKWTCSWVVLALLGCHEQPTASPRAVANAVVTAMDKGDVPRFMAVLPSLAQLGQAFDCGHADGLRAALQRRFDDVPSEFEARRQANFRMRLVTFDDAGSETSQLGAGDVFRNCIAREVVMVHRSKLKLSRTRGGRNEDVVEQWTFLQFEPDGPWYFGKL